MSERFELREMGLSANERFQDIKRTCAKRGL